MKSRFMLTVGVLVGIYATSYAQTSIKGNSVAEEVLVGTLDGDSKPQPDNKTTSSGDPLRTVEIYILNKTNKQIDELYFSPSNSNDWEDDVLGDNVMRHGQGDWLTFETKQTTCFYDLGVKFSNGVAATWKKLDVCTYTTFELKPNAIVTMKK